jgi:branched-chain amino acid transport system ATP-binding protein
MLEVRGIDTFHGETQALFGVSLSVAAGEVLALLGANGAGKTTLIRSVLGLTRPRRGEIRFRDKVITAWETHDIARAGVGWVPDDRRLCPTLTVAKNLALGTKATAYRSWSVGEVTEIFTALKYLMARDAETLSGGEMQMVAIGRALLGSPGLVLFDEPSQGLAPKIVSDVMAVIRRLKAEGIASVVVEQNADVALSVADRAVILSRGHVVWQGDARELAADHALKQSLLGGLQ